MLGSGMGSKTVAVVMLLAFAGAMGYVMMQGQSPAVAPAAPTAVGAASAPASTDSGGASGFVANFDGSLVVQKDGSFEDFHPAALRGVKYWAFYYSASWCPPCRAFTPTLVDFYKGFKPTHPNFELIFVNHDQSEGDMLAYMRDDSMTWPAVRFSDIEQSKANRYCGSGIPDLVLVDADGKVLSDSFSGSDYLGPQKVMADIQAMVPTP